MIISVLRSMVILTVLASLGGCGETVLSPIGPIGAAERTILLDSVAIMLARPPSGSGWSDSTWHSCRCMCWV
jgi:hypothetical protein